MTLDELRAQVAAGSVDTVLLAITDMQGRLQGKRLTARHFLDEVAEHGAEACNYLLAVDVEMNTVDGYAMSSWERGYGDFVMRPDLDDAAAGARGSEGTALCLADVAWHGRHATSSPRRARSCAASSTRLAERGWTRQRRHRARVHRLPRHLRGGVAARATATSTRPTSTTSTTRCSAPRASSR